MPSTAAIGGPLSRDGIECSLRATLSRSGLLITDPEALAHASADYRGWYRGQALAIARPTTVEEVQHVVHRCAELGCAVIPQGGNTSLCGGAVPTADDRRSIILSTAGLKQIRSISPSSWSLIAEAGCTIDEIQETARSIRRHFGLDFGARGTATIGGAIATNAGGMNVLRYGNCRDLVLGLEVVLPDGSLWSNLKSLRKDSSGPDLKHLFIGSEGLLGVITAASLKMHPAELTSSSALLSVPSIEAASAFAELAVEMAHADLSAIELMPALGIRGACDYLIHCRPPMELKTEWYVLCRLAGQDPVPEKLEQILSQAIDDGLCVDAVVAQSSAQEAALWAIRDAFSDLHKHLGASFRFDYSVPLGRIPELYESLCAEVAKVEPDFVPFGFGHLGDGNLHFSVCQPQGTDADVFVAKKPAIEDAANAVVWRLGGSISAEHGIGQLHRDELLHQKCPVEIALMRRLKAVIDPRDLFNTGKVLPG